MVELEVQDFENNCEQFSKTKKLLTDLLGDDVSISHVGSTAIPEMIGKNIIDINYRYSKAIYFHI